MQTFGNGTRVHRVPQKEDVERWFGHIQRLDSEDNTSVAYSRWKEESRQTKAELMRPCDTIPMMTVLWIQPKTQSIVKI